MARTGITATPRRSRRRAAAALAAALVAALAAGGCGTRVDRAAYFSQLGRAESPVPADGTAAGGATATPPGAADDGLPSAGSAPVADGSSATGAGSAYWAGGPGTPAGRAGRPAPAATAAGRAGSGPGAASPAAAGAPPSRAAAGTPPPAAAGSGNSSGVSTDPVGDVIRIGLHVPETGAAPLPTDWKDALAVVEDHVNAEPVHGRRIHFVAEDDGYDASRGLAACRKLADEDVLFVIGHTAPAAEEACAGLYQTRRIPYLMRGVMAKVLAGRPLAWFGTIPDDVQGGLLADYVLNRLGGRSRKAAVVYENDQTTARDSFVTRIRAGGGTVAATEEVNGRQSDFSATVQKLQQSGAELVFLSLPPVGAIKIAVQSQGQGYHPTWLGGASYWNYNMVLESAGAAMDGAVSLSPWPSVDSADAAGYRAAYQKSRPGQEPSDIGLVLWGWGNMVRAALDRAGPQLTRASFVDALQSFEFSPPDWNPIRYSRDDHRGTASVAVFRADGQARRWRQISGFADRF